MFKSMSQELKTHWLAPSASKRWFSELRRRAKRLVPSSGDVPPIRSAGEHGNSRHHEGNRRDLENQDLPHEKMACSFFAGDLAGFRVIPCQLEGLDASRSTCGDNAR